MQVELGNSTPTRGDPNSRVVTYMRIPDEYTFARNVDVEEWRSHLAESLMMNNGITNFPGGEVLNQLTHPAGMQRLFMRGTPDWVWSDDEDAARVVSEFFRCPISVRDESDFSLGHNPMVDELYWRRAGATSVPPGVTIGSVPDVKALLMNVGANNIAYQLTGKSVGATGVGTGASSTQLTGVTGLTSSVWVGAILVVADTTNSHQVYGVVTANGTTSFTVDQWYNPVTGALGTTPAAGFEYLVYWGLPPAWYMGISTTLTTPAVTDTALTGEATANGMGRKLAAATITASTATTTGPPNTSSAVSTTYTYSSSGALTFTGMALFDSSIINTANSMYFETLFSGSFTVTNNGDQATVTDTVSVS